MDVPDLKRQFPPVNQGLRSLSFLCQSANGIKQNVIERSSNVIEQIKTIVFAIKILLEILNYEPTKGGKLWFSVFLFKKRNGNMIRVRQYFSFICCYLQLQVLTYIIALITLMHSKKNPVWFMHLSWNSISNMQTNKNQFSQYRGNLRKQFITMSYKTHYS